MPHEATKFALDDALSYRNYDINGYMEVSDNPLSREGVFPYLGRSLGPEYEADTVYNVLRPRDELADPKCIESFKLTPWIDEHEMLGESAGLTPVEEKVVMGVIGENVYFDDASGMLKGNIKLFSNRLQGNIDSGEKRELSAGYRCRYEKSSGVYNGQSYDVIQRDIRGNHLASVKQGRMGPEVAVLDHLKFTFDAREIMPDKEDKSEKTMDAAEVKKMVEDAVEAAMKARDEKESMKEGKDGDTDRKDGDETRPGKDSKKGMDKGSKDSSEKECEDDDADMEGEGSDKKHGKDGMKSDGEKSEGTASDKKHGMDMKDVLREVSMRDRLADQLSGFIGTFDAAEMTLDEVARYGAKKLGVEGMGSPITAVRAYLHNRVAPHKDQRLFGMDSANGASGATGEVDKYING